MNSDALYGRMRLITALIGGLTLSFGCADLPDTPADVDARGQRPEFLDGGRDVQSTPVDLGRPRDASHSMGDTSPEMMDSGPTGDAEMLTVDAQTPPLSVTGPVLYGAGRTHSPITPSVVQRLRQISAMGAEMQPDVFMKVGASSTVSRSTLACFAGGGVDLDEHGHLEPTLDYFLGGDAAGDTSFDRRTLAARSGHSARWAVGGDPSPMDEEIAAISPSVAFVHYGTNDMGLGSTYMSAMHGFHDSMMTLVDELIGQGIIPILTGISPRADRPSADLWVGAYNAVIRGMAQGHQIPFLDLHHATYELDGYGLAGDGIHLNGYRGGPCVLTPAGLEYGYNVRNLIALESLDRVRSARDDEQESDVVAPRLSGEGNYEDPFLIDALPFADLRDTRSSDLRRHDVYPSCTDTNESGPEYVYRYETDETVKLRAIVLDQGEVDIDLHILDESGQGEGCLARDHTHLEVTLEPGVYHFVLDTFTNSGGVEFAGEYLFTVLECDRGDVSCDGAL